MPWLQSVVRTAQGKVVRSETTRVSVVLVEAGVALVIGRWTTEMASMMGLVMGLVVRAQWLVLAWLELAVRPQVVMGMD